MKNTKRQFSGYICIYLVCSCILLSVEEILLLFQVYGDKDADGFYWGECRGRRGFVPHNMVVEVQDTVKEGGRGGPRDRWGDIYANMPVKKMIALYDYDPQELSPNVDAEVSISS